MKIADNDTDIYDAGKHSIGLPALSLSALINHDIIMVKTPAERSREYRARKKARTNTINQHLMSMKSPVSVLKKNNVCIVKQESSQQSITDDEDVTHENNHLILYKYLTHQQIPDSKQIGSDHQSTGIQVDVQGQSIDQNNVSVLKKKLKTAKTSAERSREYRARKKALKNAVIE